MHTTAARTVLALAALLWLTAAGAADPPKLLPVAEHQPAPPSGQHDQAEVEVQQVEVQQVAYASENVAGGSLLGYGATYASTPYPAYNGSAVFQAPQPDCADMCEDPTPLGQYFVELQMMFLRAHMLENSLGKLSEKYEFSPRLVLGYESAQGVGGRLRYWSYAHSTPNLSVPADRLRLDFDVIDLEGTYRFGTSHNTLTAGGGFRWATMDVGAGGAVVGTEMPGITFAADLRSAFHRGCSSEWGAVAGVRWTALGGDWQGSGAGLIAPTHDDNIVTHEYYGGFEYLRDIDGIDLYARLVFEVQNWHSDALSQTGGADSIGFVGPGLQLGAEF